MAATARLIWTLVLDDGTRIEQWGPVVKDLAVGNARHEQEGEVAPAASVKFYDAAEDIAAIWSVLRLESAKHLDGTAAQDLIIELTVDIDNSIGKELATLPLKAGSVLLLTSPQAFAAYVENFAGGTLDKIERVRVYNPGGTKGYAKILLQ